MKKCYINVLSVILAITCTLTFFGCNQEKQVQETPTEQTTTTQQEPTVTVPNSYVNLSKDPADYEKPKDLSADLSIVCVSYKTLDKTHFIKAFKSDDGNYYMILPSAVDLTNVALYFFTKNGSVKVDNLAVNGQIKFYDFSDGKSIEFSYSNKATKVTEVCTIFVQTSVVPVVYLDVDESLGTIKAMQSDKAKNTHAYGTMYLDSENDAHDLVSYFDIHGHGNSTWTGNPDKKQPYNIKFTEDDNYDDGRKVKLLGMRANSKWCLLSDASERSFLRTRTAHYLGAQVEIDYALQNSYANVYMGSDYIGAYYLIERTVEVADNLDLELATGDNMNGSWVVEFDNASGQPNQFKVNGVKVTVKSPIEGCNYKALQKYLAEVHVALNDPNGYNATTGKYYYDYIDLESYAKFLLIREFSMDYDLVVDHWAYYDAEEGKMNAGPLWDFNNSMWTCAGARGHLPMYKETDKLLVLQDDKGPGCWLQALMQFEKFTDLLKEQYDKYSYLFDLEDPRCIYNVYEGWFEEVKPIAEQNDLLWNTLKDTEALKGFEYDNSEYAPYFAYVAKFLYERCQDYGPALEKYANGKK